jgi:hypothetical protein
VKQPRRATLTNDIAMTGRDGAIDYAAKSELIAGGGSVALDEGSDFTIDRGGLIVITPDGFDRIAAAHDAGSDAVVVVDKSERVRFKVA